MRSFSIGSGDNQQYSAGSFSGIDITARLTAASVGIDNISRKHIDWSFINVKVILNRGGKSFTIMNDSVLPLALASGYYKNTYPLTAEIGNYPHNLVVLGTAGAKFVSIQPARINFGGIVNLVSGDLLQVELSSSAGAIDTTYIDPASAAIHWQLVDAVGNSFGVPFVRAQSLTGGQSAMDFSFSDGVSSVFFINQDKNSGLEADNVITSIQFQSDKLSTNLTNEQLVLKRYTQFVDLLGNGVGGIRGQSFNLIDSKDFILDSYEYSNVVLRNVLLRLNTNANNVSAGSNWIVGIGYFTDTLTAKIAYTRKKRHDKSNAQALVSTASTSSTSN